MSAKKIPQKSKCNSCCAADDKKKTLDAEIKVPKGTSFDGENKALIAFSEEKMRADPCLESTNVKVVEDGGWNTTSGGWSRADMMKSPSVWESNVLGPGATPSYSVVEGAGNASTLTPKGIQLLTIKGY